LTIKVDRRTSTKANVALFVCMSTKAGYKRVHRCSHLFCVSMWTLSAHLFGQRDQLCRCYELLNDRSHKKLVCNTVTPTGLHTLAPSDSPDSPSVPITLFFNSLCGSHTLTECSISTKIYNTQHTVVSHFFLSLHTYVVRHNPTKKRAH
jgi:hypothetical protein